MSVNFDIDHSSIPEPSERRVYSVTEITREIKALIESEWPIVWIEGEISNFKRHASGHFYFSLKDAEAQIGCVMWRGRNQGLLFEPEDGIKVQVLGQMTVYERQGRYQLDVHRIQPAGRGELQMAFESLKQRLLEKGYFDPEHKKSLPAFPERIGVITSSTGAAIRDIVSVISRRFPSVQLILNPVRVQGMEAAGEIARAIQEFNEWQQVDVMIIGRGGGSLEDLWPFNEEVVAEAIYQSRIPIISAVGHEIDFSISDFVADMRAPTPSAAAEMIVRDREELKFLLYENIRRIIRHLQNRLQLSRERIGYLGKSYAFRYPEDRVREYRQRADDLRDRMDRSESRRIESTRQRLTHLQVQMRALNPANILERGYSITRRLRDEQLVKTTSDVVPEEQIRIQLAKGQIISTVVNLEQAS